MARGKKVAPVVEPEIVVEPEQPKRVEMSKESLAKLRYFGRAYVRWQMGLFQKEEDGTITQPGSNGKRYTTTAESCGCGEFVVNGLNAKAVAEGKRIFRNPGDVCKHTMVYKIVNGDLDPVAAIAKLSEAQKAIAHKAAVEESRTIKINRISL